MAYRLCSSFISLSCWKQRVRKKSRRNCLWIERQVERGTYWVRIWSPPEIRNIRTHQSLPPLQPFCALLWLSMWSLFFRQWNSNDKEEYCFSSSRKTCQRTKGKADAVIATAAQGLKGSASLYSDPTREELHLKKEAKEKDTCTIQHSLVRLAELHKAWTTKQRPWAMHRLKFTSLLTHISARYN